MLLRKLKSDKGDGVLVGALILTIVFFLVLAVMFDSVKNGAVRSDLTSMAQQSTDASIRTANSQGRLDWRAAEVAVNEYSLQREGLDGSTSESRTFASKQCSTGMVNGVERELPYYELRLDTSRGSGASGGASKVLAFSGAMPSSQDRPQLDPGADYSVLQMTVYDSTSNLLLNSFGKGCQMFEISTSATTFSDLMNEKEE